MLCRKLFQSSFFFFCNFLRDISILSIFQLLGIFLHIFLDEDGPSSPILYAKFLSLAELGLSIEYLPRTVVFEIPLKKKLVELFVEDVLRDLIHQNRTFCDSSE